VGCVIDTNAVAGKDRGFVLVLVIFVTALIALLALAFSASVRSHMRLAAAAIQGAKAEALADAGVQLAVLSVVAGPQGAARNRRFPIDGSPVSCAIDDQSFVVLRTQDAGGRVSINLAGERMLLALFIGAGASREAASRATDLILDYRDPDSNRRVNGAERPEYIAAGRPQGPKNAPFDTIEELDQVLGLDPALIAAVLPFITVHSQTAGLDPRAAVPELAASLARGIAELPSRQGPALTDPGIVPAEFVVGSPQRVFSIVAEGRLDNGAVFVRETVVELQSTRAAVPLYRMWKRGTVSGSQAAVQPGSLPPC
jgi:general secretion pathway protein K